MNSKRNKDLTSSSSTNIDEILQQGLEFHKTGKLKKAQKCYAQILQSYPKNFEALQLSATLNLQQQKYKESLKFIESALSINPKIPHLNYNHGIILFEMKDFKGAIASFDRAIELQPDLVEALFNRGNALTKINKYHESIVSYKRAIEIKPDFAEAFYNCGNSLKELKKFDEAVISYKRATELKPDHFKAFNNQGLAMHSVNKFQEAITSFDRAIELNPDFAEAFNARGIALKELKQFDEAIISYKRAIELKPDFAEAFYNCGIALKELKQFKKAIASYERAIELKPDYSKAFNNLGLTMHDLNKFQEAIASYDQAIKLNPYYAEAFNNRGNALKELKQLDEAIGNYDTAIQLKPDFVEVIWNKGYSKLLLGEYEEGWQLYESRKERDKTKNDYPKFSATLWNGKVSIENKTLLVHCEQGFGDTIQFSRYLLTLDHFNAKEIYLIVQKPLKNLFSGFHKKINIVDTSQPPKVDFYCSLMSLPYLLKTKVETIPAKIPYIKLNNLKNKKWEDELKKSNKLRIGLAWSGSTIHENDHNRSLKLKQLSSLLSLPFEFHCLQKEIRDCDIETLKSCENIFQHQNNLNDFSDTAGLINQMDLIISVDTSVAHLSGAIGKKVWLLLPFMPDFRWMLDRDDSPWYPNLKLFRQPTISDWESVIKLLMIDLKNY